MEVTYLKNAVDEREKEDCSRLFTYRPRAIVQARTSMNERQSNTQVLTLMHTIKYTHRAIEISRSFLALEYCELKSKLCTNTTVFIALAIGLKMWDKCRCIPRNANITISRYCTKKRFIDAQKLTHAAKTEN